LGSLTGALALLPPLCIRGSFGGLTVKFDSLDTLLPVALASIHSLLVEEE
jgi:hypothetical protein